MSTTHAKHTLLVELASTPEAVRESQALRYQIFAGEQRAVLESEADNIDRDHYDSHCHHLLVRETHSQRVVGSTRILTTPNARDAGNFYSENEFELGHMYPNLRGNAIEIGRTCIHKDYRNGSGIAMLWMGLAQFMKFHKTDYLFGCASISMRDGGQQAIALMEEARRKYLAPEEFRVTPRVRLLGTAPAEHLQIPPLLRTYLKLGAWIAGEPCLDPDFNVADFFILLDVNNLNNRYHRHFVQAAMEQSRNPHVTRSLSMAA